MLRFHVKRLASFNSRLFATGAAQGAALGARGSVLAQRIVAHRKETKEFRTNYGRKVIGEQPYGYMRGIRGLVTGSSYLNSAESVAIENAHESVPDINYKATRTSVMNQLERIFALFEDKCQRLEMVTERDLVRTFDKFTRTVEQLEAIGALDDDVKVHLALLAGILLRCCGRLMLYTPPKAREMLAGNVWTFIKEKKIPLDTSLYNCLIKVLNENQTAIDPQSILDEMKAAHLEPDRVTYQRLIHQYCVKGDVTSASSLLEVMKEKGMELNEATLASLIVGYVQQDDPPSIDELFELMRNNSIEPGSLSYSAAIQSCVRLSKKDPTRAFEELNKLYQNIKDHDIQFTIHELRSILCELQTLKDHEFVTKLLDHLTQSGFTNINYRNRFIGLLIDCGQLEEASKQFWSIEPSIHAKSSGNFGNAYVRALARANVPIDHVISECTRLVASDSNPNALHYLYYTAASAGNLALVRAALERIGESEPLKCHYYWPLLAQAQNNDEILNVLKKDMNPNMNIFGLLETFADWVWPRFSENPQELFELNKNELKYDNSMLISSYLDYCVAKNQISKAVEFISKLPQQESANQESINEEDSEQVSYDKLTVNQDQSFNTNDLMGRLLNQIAEQSQDPAMVDKALTLYTNPGLKMTSRTLTPVVKVRLDNSDDFKSTLDCFLDIARKYEVTPCKENLMIRCLEKKDSDSLQKIMDVSVRIYGEANSLFDLACACIICGKMKQANKILSSPDFRVNPSRVYGVCKSMSQRQSLETLERFVFATKNLPEVSHDQLYEILLNAYGKSGNQKRALNLWNKMQEDDFQPSRRTLIHIATMLGKKNIPVPFPIPKNYPAASR